jgi:hypothetical protein
MNERKELAILFSGGTDSLALYALATAGQLQNIMQPRSIHLLHMLNGMSRFHDFPRKRFELAKTILSGRFTGDDSIPASSYAELDMGRLFQGLWLDVYEEYMPRYNNKNLVCVACKLAMHTRAIIHCIENLIPLLVTGYSKKQSYYPEQTPVFMKKIAEFSAHFGITTSFPVYDDFDDKTVTRYALEDFGLPSTGGGERKCLFSQTLTTTTEKEIGHYMDDMLPKLTMFINHRQAGRVKEAANCFPPGNIHGLT